MVSVLPYTGMRETALTVQGNSPRQERKRGVVLAIHPYYLLHNDFPGHGGMDFAVVVESSFLLKSVTEGGILG